MNPQQPVTVRVVTLLSRGNVIVEEWTRACEEARQNGEHAPEMPVVTEDDFLEIIGERVTLFSS